MMKDTKTEKNKLRRYLDDMYIREEASQLLESMRDADHKDILDELSAEVWEESVSQQPVTDLEREKYKKEARQLLKHIEHKKRTWFRRVMTIAALSLIHICKTECQHFSAVISPSFSFP